MSGNWGASAETEGRSQGPLWVEAVLCKVSFLRMAAVGESGCCERGEGLLGGLVLSLAPNIALAENDSFVRTAVTDALRSEWRLCVNSFLAANYSDMLSSPHWIEYILGILEIRKVAAKESNGALS